MFNLKTSIYIQYKIQWKPHHSGIQLLSRRVARIFHREGGGGGGGVYFKNRDQIINVWMICQASFKDTRVWGGGHASPEKFWNLRSSNCWKCIETVNPTITTLFCFILNLLRSRQADLFGSWPALQQALLTCWNHCSRKTQVRTAEVG